MGTSLSRCAHALFTNKCFSICVDYEAVCKGKFAAHCFLQGCLFAILYQSTSKILQQKKRSIFV